MVDTISGFVKFHFQVSSKLFFDGFDAMEDAEAVLQWVFAFAGDSITDAEIEKAVRAVESDRLGFYDFGDAGILSVGSVQSRQRSLDIGLPVALIAAQ